MLVLQMTETIIVAKLTEFSAVQLELLITVLCDTLPLYFFIYQHIKNLRN